MLAAIAALTVNLASCTHNGGTLNGLFGTWHVDAITVNGTSVDTHSSYYTDAFFKFQSGVFAINVTNADKGYYDFTYASFAWADASHITINFSDSNYKPYAESHMAAGNNLLEVTSLSGSHLSLKLTTTTETVVYTLSKI